MDKEDSRLLGECAFVADKIFDKCESMEGGWDDLLNMIASIDDFSLKTEQDLYNYHYKFLQNVYWRIHSWDVAQEFDRVFDKEVYAERDGKLRHVEGYSIWNYSYKVFKWAVQRGFTYGMGTQMLDVPKDILTEPEIKRFEKMKEGK